MDNLKLALTEYKKAFSHKLNAYKSASSNIPTLVETHTLLQPNAIEEESPDQPLNQSVSPAKTETTPRSQHKHPTKTDTSARPKDTNNHIETIKYPSSHARGPSVQKPMPPLAPSSNRRVAKPHRRYAKKIIITIGLSLALFLLLFFL